MAIFLHFMNREPYRAVHAPFNVAAVNASLRTLALATDEDLYTNLSNLLESGLLSPAQVLPAQATLTRLMLENDQILIAGERPSVAEFLESRAERYKFDSSRYPMYFTPTLPQSLRVLRVGAGGTTAYLADEVIRIANCERSPRDVGLNAHDSALVSRASTEIVRITKDRNEQAITRSFFAGKLGNEETESATARLISSIYVLRYLKELNCDIATGARGLSAFDVLGTGVWNRNITVLNAILDGLGLPDLFSASGASVDEFIAAARRAKSHARFCDCLRTFCAIGERIQKKKAVNERPEVLVRRLIAMAEPKVLSASLGASFYEDVTQSLVAAISVLRRRNRCFDEAYEAHIVENDKIKTVLLVTATTAETRALRAVSAEIVGSTMSCSIPKNDYIATELGQLTGLRLIHVQCEPGSVGASNSQAVISDAIRDFAPAAVIMGGIAFGADNAKQQLGDVLVAKTIVEYERAKVKGARQISRGQRIECSPKLLSLFREADAQGVYSRIHFGVLLSGEKLVDSEAFLRKLLKQEPEAIGGEMEGAGLVAAAKRASVDWILVKSIVDWGMKKESNNSPDHQENIAKNAFQVIFAALRRIGL